MPRSPQALERRKRKRGKHHSPAAALQAGAPPREEKKKKELVASPWLARFLTVDRSSLNGTEDIPLENEPLSDAVLTNFSRRCAEEANPRSESDDDSDHSVEVAELEQPRRDDDEAEKKRLIFISNLSFATTQATVRARCEKFGAIDKLVLPVVQKRLAGYALVTFSAAKEAAAAMAGLDGVKLDGRVLHVKAGEQNKAPRKATPRYFKATPLPRSRNPCSFCAKSGHLMDACPQSLCDKCFEPGHQTKRCRKVDEPTPVLCTACGSWGHSWKWCTAIDEDDKLEKGAICVACGQVGHSNCRPSALRVTTAVFCSWCAKEGHTEPSCPARHGTRRRSDPPRHSVDDEHRAAKKQRHRSEAPSAKGQRR